MTQEMETTKKALRKLADRKDMDSKELKAIDIKLAALIFEKKKHGKHPDTPLPIPNN